MSFQVGRHSLEVFSDLREAFAAVTQGSKVHVMVPGCVPQGVPLLQVSSDRHACWCLAGMDAGEELTNRLAGL